MAGGEDPWDADEVRTLGTGRHGLKIRANRMSRVDDPRCRFQGGL